MEIESRPNFNKFSSIILYFNISPLMFFYSWSFSYEVSGRILPGGTSLSSLEWTAPCGVFPSSFASLIHLSFINNSCTPGQIYYDSSMQLGKWKLFVSKRGDRSVWTGGESRRLVHRFPVFYSGGPVESPCWPRWSRLRRLHHQLHTAKKLGEHSTQTWSQFFSR